MRNRAGMKSLAVIVGLALVLAVGAGVAFGKEKFQEKFEKTEALARDGKVYLSNISGDIKTSEADSLEKAKENAGLVKIEVTTEAGAVRIETKYPERRTFWGGESVNVSVDYKISVPEMASVDVTSISGDVRVDKIGGMAKTNSVSGNVDLMGAAGADIKVVSGDLTVDAVTGDTYLKTVSGDVRANGIKGSVEVESVSGDIELKNVSGARSLTGKSVSGNITYVGTVQAGGNYELKSHSGNIEMSIPAESAFDLEANTFSGVIDSDFPIEVSGKMSPKQLRGTVNKGGARVRLATFSGNIDLKK
jgi:DUF4097 and DUF4098 domain-containing protein YvlB